MNRRPETVASYLRTIYQVVEDGLVPLRARICERLNLAGPTVTQTVLRLERDGLISDTTTGPELVLTPDGLRIAVAVTRKHRLAERMLSDVLGIPAQHVHDEASKWEHALSDAAEQGIIALLNDPTESVWGNPIPGLDALGVARTPRSPAPRLADIGRSKHPIAATVRSISEDAQSDHTFIRALIEAGVIPGAPVHIKHSRKSYLLHGLNNIEIPIKRGHVLRVDCS